MTGEILSEPASDNPGVTPPGDTTIAALTAIWQRVLKRPKIGPDDEFHDLGGNDPLADRIFAEIAQTFHRQLPSATICYAPTIASLTEILEKSELPRFPPFVRLKAGSGKTPILIAHGLGGRASFTELARHIRTEHPVYGIQAKGVDGLEEPLGSIEDMASFYLEELRQLQPDGPYILIGYSFGGLIALEMAQRLRTEGKSIALLTLVDTYPHPRYLPAGQRLRLIAKRIWGHISSLQRKPVGAGLSQVQDALKRRLPMPEVVSSLVNPAEQSRLSFEQTMRRVRESDLRAMKQYRPRFYPGRIRFVRPEANSYLPADPAAVWKHLAAELEIEKVPGDHLGMITSNFVSLAETLTRYVREASVQ
jgi:acetoacetyl-CoA synthetase